MRTGSLTNTLLTATIALATGCVASPQGDGKDDSFVADGKDDTGGVSDGSPQAIAVLRVANQTSATTLEHAAGLAKNAANAIVAYRRGDDGVAGTADDAVFHSLEELDAVPYVGPIAFHDMLAYATSLGYLAGVSDPFSADPTGQPIASYLQLTALLPPGLLHGKIGTFSMYEQQRACNAAGCSDWQDTTSLDLMPYDDMPAITTLDNLPLSGDTYLFADGSSPSSNLNMFFQGTPRADGYRLLTECFVGPAVNSYVGQILRARGVYTCNTYATPVDYVGVTLLGYGPSDELTLLWISGAPLIPIDWAGSAATDPGYVTPYGAKLVSNTDADYYKQTARMALVATFK